jgi:hypothetical protein
MVVEKAYCENNKGSISPLLQNAVIIFRDHHCPFFVLTDLISSPTE